MFWTMANPKAVWSSNLRSTQVSPCQWSVNCCVQACKQTHRGTQTKETREMYMVLSAESSLHIIHCFSHSPFVCFFECKLSHTQFICSDALSKLSVEISFNDVHVPRRLHDFVDHIIHFSMWWSACPRCGMYTLISVMRCLLIVMKVAMTRSLMYFVQFIFSPLSVQNSCKNVFVLLLSCAHDDVTLACLPYFCFT